MSVRSIGAGSADGYASYLESKTVAPERGDYYLGRDGEPIEAPGRWLSSPATLGRLGIDPGREVARDDLVALMQGRRPGSEEYLRAAGPTGTRNAGADVVLSAPKSVSIAWALGDDQVRGEIERLHAEAVDRTFAYLRDSVAITTRRDAAGRNEPVTAQDLVAAEFRHSTARGLQGRAPDPLLHSHVVVTSVIRRDGKVAAVRDRSLYRAAREGGAYYRAALAAALQEAGWTVEAGTGKHGRYFELAGVSAEAIRAFSGRSREIEKVVRQFEAREGRKPSEAELQLIKVDTRARKQPATQPELRQAWSDTAERHGQRPLAPGERAPRIDRSRWGTRVERALTTERATFTERELRATALEQAAGELDPDRALGHLHGLATRGYVLALDNGMWTTRTIRELERSIGHEVAVMGGSPAPAPHPRAISAGIDLATERIGAPLTREQRRAVDVLTGPHRIAALEGQAGTGKGVVLDVVAYAERISGRNVIGVALAGATAERLGQDSPALAQRTTTIASLLHRIKQDPGTLDPATTVFLDEAGMVDTPTLEALLRATSEAGSKLIAVGDGRQLPAIGPGGMFDQLARHAPRAELGDVHRTPDPDERRAWRALRNGHPEQAMAHYLARGQLHLTDDRDQALEAAVTRYHQLATEHGHEHVALMSDGSGHEIERMNARAQHLRHEAGQLGHHSIPLPDTGDDTIPYELRAGDLVTWRQIQRVPDDARIENGTRGTITHTDPRRQQLTIRLTGSDRHVTVTGPDQLASLRLGYAQHVVRQQGATVDRAVALTGGWQTSRESAYVQASRARHGIDWYTARNDLGHHGTDSDRIQRLADKLARHAAKTPSINHDLATTQLDPATLQTDLTIDADFPLVRPHLEPRHDITPDI